MTQSLSLMPHIYAKRNHPILRMSSSRSLPPAALTFAIQSSICQILLPFWQRCMNIFPIYVACIYGRVQTGLSALTVSHISGTTFWAKSLHI